MKKLFKGLLYSFGLLLIVGIFYLVNKPKAIDKGRSDFFSPPLDFP